MAWSPDLGGLPVDAETAKVTADAPAVLAELGARVDRVELDLSDAEDAFRIYRAWYYALCYGDLPQERLGANVRWNVERGHEVTGADLARAERLRSGLYQRMDSFFGTYDFLIAPVSQVPPFPVDAPYVSEINGQALPDYLAWMRSAYWVSVLHTPRRRCRAGSPRAGCRWACRSSGVPSPTWRCSGWPTPSSAPPGTARAGRPSDATGRPGHYRPSMSYDDSGP